MTEAKAGIDAEVWDVYLSEQQLTETLTTDSQGRYSVTHIARYWPSGQARLVLTPTSTFIASATATIYIAPYYPGVVINAFAGYWVAEGVVQFAGRVTAAGTPPPNFAFALQRQTPQGWQTVGSAVATRVPEWGPDA